MKVIDWQQLIRQGKSMNRTNCKKISSIERVWNRLALNGFLPFNTINRIQNCFESFALVFGFCLMADDMASQTVRSGPYYSEVTSLMHAFIHLVFVFLENWHHFETMKISFTLYLAIFYWIYSILRIGDSQIYFDNDKLGRVGLVGLG